MFVAAKFGDPVIGVDIHMVLVPAPPAPAPVPAPLPHPFIGVVFDPIGAAVGAAIGAVFGGGGPVLINGLPVGNTGTEVKGMAHLPTPPGVSFAPNDIPDNEGTIVLGSKTVSLGGSSAGRLTSAVMTCNFPVNLPTSMCLAVPMGAPVLVGGPDSLDVMAAVTRGIRTKWFSGLLHKMLKPGPRLSKLICFLTGHPVDVMSGEVLADALDFELPGPIPLVFERGYYSRSLYDGPLGPGWTHPLDVSLSEGKTGVLLRLPDGREREHDPLKDGQSVRDDIDRYTLARVGSSYRMTTWNGRTYWLETIAGSAAGGESRHAGTPEAPDPGAPTHRLARIVDRCNNAVTLRYEGGRRLTRVEDSAGRVLQVFWTKRGDRLDRIECAQRTLVRYSYDEKGMLAAATDAEGHALRYAYEGGVLVCETNRNGLSFHFEYDAHEPAGWCVRTWGDGGLYERRITYSKIQHMTVVDDGRGGRTHYFGNAAGLVDREVDPTGREKRYEWDAYYRKVAEVSGLGHRTEWEYDARGNLLVQRDAAGAEINRRFNALDLPVEIEDAAGGKYLLSYDRRGCLTEIVDPTLASRRFSHDERGLLREAIGPMGRRFRIERNTAGEITGTLDGEGATTRYGWDAWGRLVRHEDARGAVTTLERDRCHRIVRLGRPDGSATSLRHDPEGNVIERTDGQGHSTRNSYVGLNRLAETVDPAGGTVKYTYDTEQDLTGIENEHGERYRFELDLAGRVVKEVGFDGRVLVFRHDAAGRCQEVVNGLRKVTRIERDAVGRVVKQLVPGAPTMRAPVPEPEETAMAYDRRGQLVRAVNPHAEVTFARDALGRVVEERVKIGEDVHTVRSRRDAAGHRVARTTSHGHETRYDIDERGLLAGLSFSAPAPGKEDGAGVEERPAFRPWWGSTLRRDVEGAEIERCLPGGVVARWDRDALGRGRVLRAGGPWEAGFSRGYQWRSEGRLAAIIDGVTGPMFLEHDARGHLSAARRPEGVTQHRSSDAAGLVYRSRDRSDRTYEKGGVLRRAGEVEYEHDADGQLVEKRLPGGKSWKYRWDGAGQLAEVTRPDGEKVSFAYDALGRRVQKTAAGETTTYVWDGDDLVHEIGAGADVVTWEFEPGTFAPLAKVEGDRRYGIVTDHLGAPVALFDEAGRLAWKAQLDLYGVARLDVRKTGCPWRFPGQYEDEETGLYYNRFRYHDPESGRYISQDPIRVAGGLDLYGYVRDVFTWTDPLGLSGCKIYRGTDFGNEKDIFRETGLVMSDAAREAYNSARYAGKSMDEAIEAALGASQQAHAGQLQAWGSLENYVMAHGLWGQEIKVFGPRSLISFTTDPGVTSRFGRTVLSGIVDPSALLRQTIGGSEAEVLIPHMVKL